MAHPSTTADLDQQLPDAHAKGDRHKLVALYTLAVDQKEAEEDVEAACFFRTQAFIFALESVDTLTAELNQRLVEYGREEPLSN